MDGYTDSKVNKKVYIIPLVALLLCSTAFVGLAYAYSSTVEVTNNPLDGQYYELDYTNGLGEPINAVIALNDSADFTVHTEIAIVDSDNDEDSRTFDAIIEAGSFQRVFYVKMYSDIPNKTFNLSAPTNNTLDSVLSQFITGVNCTFSKNNVVNGDIVTVTVTFTIGNDVSLKTIDAGVTDRESMIEAINTICSNHKYVISVVATPNGA